MVLLTLFGAERMAGYSGQGDDLLGAVSEAVSVALATEPPGEPPRRLQLDLVLDEPTLLPKPEEDGTIADLAGREAWSRVTAWLDGLVVVREGRASWLVPQQLILQGMGRADREFDAANATDLLELATGRLGMPPGAWKDPELSFMRFRSAAWVEDETYQYALPLVQGIVPAATAPSAQRLVASAVAGGEYLLRVQQENGSFVYVLDPWLETRTGLGNNIVRHAGTTWSLFTLFQHTGDERFYEGGCHGLDFLAAWCKPGTEDGLEFVLDLNGKAKLGATGLGLLAITGRLDTRPRPGDLDWGMRLARQILAFQNPDGSFEGYLKRKGTEKSGQVSLYYPGEAILGMVRLSRHLPDERILESAHRGARYLIEARRGIGHLPPDAWLIQALEDLYALTPEPDYAEHGIAIAMSMIAVQFGPEWPAGFAGGTAPLPIRSARTSARAEGLLAAYRLARRIGDLRADRIWNSLLRLAPNCLQLQYDRDNSFFLPEPETAFGGVRGGLDDASIRIDYVQHHVSLVLGIAALL